MGYGPSQPSCFHRGRLRDLTHVHLGQRENSLDYFFPLCVKLLWYTLINFPHLSRGRLGSLLCCSISAASVSTVYRVLCVKGGCPVSPPRCCSFGFIFRPAICHCSRTPSSTSLVHRHGAFVPPGASHGHILHIWQTVFMWRLALPLASPAGDGGRAAAALKSWFCVVEVWGSDVRGLEAKVAALAAQVAGGGLHPGRVVEFRPWWWITVAVWPTVLVLAWPQSDLTLGYGDLIWDGNTAMMISVWAWQYI